MIQTSYSFSAVCFFFLKTSSAAGHICRHLQEKRWTKCLQSVRRRGFVFSFI
ncbi:hypothetical protein HanPSC8_Chr13g0558391 [Helianthus annuus]|nr:hypothetical protein HanPSC8_Chr13g0558391 [Helianthus annuus]